MDKQEFLIRQVDEVFVYQGRRIKVVNADCITDRCRQCFFKNLCMSHVFEDVESVLDIAGICTGYFRTDWTDVVFMEED